MIHPSARALAGVVAAGVLLSGCTSDPDPGVATGPSASASTSAGSGGRASASASPSSTLTPAEQQAFDEATKVVLAYRQTITDLYSGARTNLNDLNEVAAGELLDSGLVDLQQSLSAGWRSEPKGVQLQLASAEPISVSLGSNPETVVIRACIDSTAVSGVSPDGVRTRGSRESSDYTVTRMSYLADPGWAVTRTKVAKDPEEREC